MRKGSIITIININRACENFSVNNVKKGLL